MQSNCHFLGEFKDDHLIKDMPYYTKLLDCNVSDLSRNLFLRLTTALSHLSLNKPNKTILELILNQKQNVFPSYQSIEQIMNLRDPESRVSQAFAKLGTHDCRCDLTWLIQTLFLIDEFRVLRGILITAPPWVEMMNKSQISEGENIKYHVKTISSLTVKWFRNESQYFGEDEIEIPEFSTQDVSLYPRVNGKYYLVISKEGGREDFQSKCTVVRSAGGERAPEPENVDHSRCALLIGVMDYKPPMTPLKAAATDIPKLDRTLRKIGFEVISFIDMKASTFKRILQKFSAKIRETSYVFFYFAGHGVQIRNCDHISLQDENNETAHISIVNVVEALVRNKPKTILTVFDMCRSLDNNESDGGSITPNTSQIPQYPNFNVIMATCPTFQAFEKNMRNEGKYEQSTSLIMQPLIDALLKFACKSISSFFAEFSDNCNAITKDQIPILYSCSAQPIGIEEQRREFCIKKIEGAEDLRDEAQLSVSFHGCIYNMVKAIVSQGKWRLQRDAKSELLTELKIDLFQHNLKKTESGTMEIMFCLKNTESALVSNISVEIPKEIAYFLED